MMRYAFAAAVLTGAALSVYHPHRIPDPRALSAPPT